MTQPVSLPFWLFIILCILAGLAVLERLLIPSIRWFFRRKVKEVIHQLNDRLQIEIQPFKLTRRQSLIDRLVYDARVIEAAEKRANEEGCSREAVLDEVKVYAREIVPAFNAYIYFRFGYWLSKKIARTLYRVRLGFSDDEALSKIAPNSTVIFVMNHRSNMDYILVTFFAASRTALSYAVGEWARVWPLQTLIRSLGAYFVRRRSGNNLYRKVLERYVQIATAEGVTQAVFPEGGLSRDGKMQQPKLGLLDYLLRDYDPNGARDLVFIPVGVNYDRSLEDRTLLLDIQDAPKPRLGFTVRNTAKFAAHHFGLMLRGHWFRFGYACVNFGAPISMKNYLTTHNLDLRRMEKTSRFKHVRVLADQLMTDVAQMTPVLPVPLMATVFLQAEDEWLDALELKRMAGNLIRELEARNAHIYIPREDRDYAISVGLRMLELRRLIEKREGLYQRKEDQRHMLEYYANSLLPFKSDYEA